MSCESLSVADFRMDNMTEEEDCKEQLLSHVRELHEAVVEMKSAFIAAQLQLQNITSDDDSSSFMKNELDLTKQKCETQYSDLLQLVLTLKGEVTCMKENIQSSQFIQHGLQTTIHTLLMERDILLDELLKNGAISGEIRLRLYNRLNGCDIPPRPSSGSHSQQSSNDNDSGVALLENGLAKPNPESNPNPGALSYPNFPNRCSRKTNVQAYLNTLHPHGSSGANDLQNASNGEFIEELNSGLNGTAYDSDCSLTLAATKSLSLSNSLSKQCGLGLNHDEIRKAVLFQQAELEGVRHGGGGTSEQGLLSFKEGQRLKVAKELLETESRYCGTLKTIRETFALSLQKSGILSNNDISTLFPEEVFVLYEKHCILLSQLEERISSWSSKSTVGDLLERFTNSEEGDVLRMYTKYINDFPEVLKTFHKLCRTSREFTQFLRGALENPNCGGLDLGAFMLSPVQRMPRYILLLKQLIKFTEPNHPDYADITRCLDRLRDYLRRLNDSMEHSFQLVTAQISPLPEDSETESQPKSGFSSLRIGKTSLFARNSICSSNSSNSQSSADEVAEQRSRNMKPRYRRSTSVPGSQDKLDSGINEVLKRGILRQEGNLKGRSKSDWTVCKSCNCSHSQASGSGTHNCTRAAQSRESNYYPDEPYQSDSDINSDGEESPYRKDDGTIRPEFTTSKSLHDFPPQDDQNQWFHKDQSPCPMALCDYENQSNESTNVRNNVLIRPLTSAKPGRYIAKIHRTSGSEVNLRVVGMKNEEFKTSNLEPHKKKSSLRTSLKNLFSLKKRNSRTLQISGPILPSKSIPFTSSDNPCSIETLRYDPAKETYQSLPPDPQPIQQRHGTSPPRRSSSPFVTGPPSLPPPPPPKTNFPRPRNLSNAAKFGNPKLPKAPFMTKYQRVNTSPGPGQGPGFDHHTTRGDRSSPYTDV